jgi:transcriptional regulator with XRE-family HTH domain
MATVTQKFGLKIRDLRKRKGLSQEKLAELAKIDYSYLNAIEAGKKNPSLKRIAKLARVLGVSLPELFTL